MRGEKVYQAMFSAFFNCNFANLFKEGGAIAPSYPPLATPLTVFEDVGCGLLCLVVVYSRTIYSCQKVDR